MPYKLSICLFLPLSAFPFLNLYYGSYRLIMFEIKLTLKFISKNVLLSWLPFIILWIFLLFLSDFRQPHSLLRLQIFLELLSILLQPLNYPFDDYIRTDPTFLVQILRSDVDERLPIHLLFLNWIESQLQSKEGTMSIEWSENQSCTSRDDHSDTFLGICYDNSSGRSINYIWISTYNQVSLKSTFKYIISHFPLKKCSSNKSTKNSNQAPSASSAKNQDRRNPSLFRSTISTSTKMTNLHVSSVTDTSASKPSSNKKINSNQVPLH